MDNSKKLQRTYELAIQRMRDYPPKREYYYHPEIGIYTNGVWRSLNGMESPLPEDWHNDNLYRDFLLEHGSPESVIGVMLDIDPGIVYNALLTLQDCCINTGLHFGPGHPERIALIAECQTQLGDILQRLIDGEFRDSQSHIGGIVEQVVL